MRKFFISIAAASVAILGGCTRIESGTVGVRLDASKQISGQELPPGGFYQTIVGEVLEFPVKEIIVQLDNKKPMTADNSALADFDITVVYGIDPNSVAELYSTKSKSFHNKSDDGIQLMAKYMETMVNNASYKVVRGYKALEVADNRAKIEEEIKDAVIAELTEQKLSTSINLSVVQIRAILPNADILAAATNYVRAQNELAIKETEVEIARKESARQQILAENGPQTIAYMNAQSNLIIANAIANGKVNTFVLPHTMTMFSPSK